MDDINSRSGIIDKVAFVTRFTWCLDLASATAIRAVSFTYWINKQLRIPKRSLAFYIPIIAIPPYRHCNNPLTNLSCLVSWKHQFIATTTVSKFFTDKHGAAPPDPPSEDSSSATSSGKRPSLFHRLHIHSSGRRIKPIPSLTIRPTTSSSLPQFSSAESRPATSHSNAATVAEISQIMPRSLRIGTPPNNSIKRQRSRESETGSTLSTKASSNNDASADSTIHDDLLKAITVKIPSYLNKGPSGKSLLFPFGSARQPGLTNRHEQISRPLSVI